MHSRRPVDLTNANGIWPVLGIRQMARWRQRLRVKGCLPRGVYVACDLGLLIGVHFASTLQLRRIAKMHNIKTKHKKWTTQAKDDRPLKPISWKQAMTMHEFLDSIFLHTRTTATLDWSRSCKSWLALQRSDETQLSPFKPL